MNKIFLKYSIIIYKIIFSSFSSPFRVLFIGGCRFSPTCSNYFELAVNKYGLFKGSYLTILRLLACNPWSRRSVIDYP